MNKRRCVANTHRWLVLCACGCTRVCERCGMAEGTIPSACMEKAPPMASWTRYIEADVKKFNDRRARQAADND